MRITTAIHSPHAEDAPGHRDARALLLHGYGSHEGDLVGLSPWLPSDVPWTSVRAPLPLIGGGHAWFPLSLPDAPDPAVVDQATESLWAWIDDNLGEEVPLVPVGFSQGGLMALQLLRTRPERIAATVVLAGLIPAAPQPADARLREERPPVFWGRGDADTVIPREGIAHLARFLPEHSSLTERVYPGLTHSVDERVMDDVRLFLDAEVSGARATSAG